MSTMVVELYEALRKAGVEDETARSAAKAVIAIEARSELATRADIAEVRADIADLKADLLKWCVGALVALTAIFSAIVKLT